MKRLRSPDVWVALGLILVLSTALGYRLSKLTVPVIETFAERAVYDAYIARAFYRDGYTLFNPPLASVLETDVTGPTSLTRAQRISRLLASQPLWESDGAPVPPNWLVPIEFLWLGHGVLDNQFALYPFVVALGYFFVGEQIVLARLVSIAFGLLSIFVLYKIGSFTGDRLGGLCAALLLALAPIHIYFSRVVMADSMLLCLWLAAIYFFLVWIRHRRVWAYAVSLASMTLAVLVKLFPISFLGALLLYGVIKLQRTVRHSAMLFVYGLVPALSGLYWYVFKTAWVTDVEIYRWKLAGLAKIPDVLFTGYPWRVPDDPWWFGFLAVVGMILVLVRLKDRAPILILLLGTVGFLVIVVNHMGGHPYYSMHLIPAGALLVGSALSVAVHGLWNLLNRTPKPFMWVWRGVTAAGCMLIVFSTATQSTSLTNEYYGERLAYYPQVAEIAEELRLLEPSTQIIGMDMNVHSLLPNYYFDRPGYNLTAQHMHTAVDNLEASRRQPVKADYFVSVFNHLMNWSRLASSELHAHLKNHYAPVYLHDSFVVYDIREHTDPERTALVAYDFLKDDWSANVYYSRNVSEYSAEGVRYVYSPADPTEDSELVYRFEFPRPLAKAFLRIHARVHPDGGLLEPYVSVDGVNFVQVGSSVIPGNNTYEISAAIGDSVTAYVMFRMRGGAGWTILSGFELHQVFERQGLGDKDHDLGLSVNEERSVDLTNEAHFLRGRFRGLVYDREQRATFLAKTVAIEQTRTLARGESLSVRDLRANGLVLRAGRLPTEFTHTITSPESAQAFLESAYSATNWEPGYLDVVYRDSPAEQDGLVFKIDLPGDISGGEITALFSNYRDAEPLTAKILTSPDGADFREIGRAAIGAGTRLPVTGTIRGESSSEELFVKLTISDSDRFKGFNEVQVSLAVADPPGALVIRRAGHLTPLAEFASASFIEGTSLQFAEDLMSVHYDLRGQALLEAAQSASQWALGYLDTAYSLDHKPATFRFDWPFPVSAKASFEARFSNYKNSEPVDISILSSGDGVNFTPVAEAVWSGGAGFPLTATVDMPPGESLHLRIFLSESDSLMGLERIRVKIETQLPAKFLEFQELSLTNTSRSPHDILFRSRPESTGNVDGLVPASLFDKSQSSRISVESSGCDAELLNITNDQATESALRFYYRFRIDPAGAVESCQVDEIRVDR